MGLFNRAANLEDISKRAAETPVIKIDSIYQGLDYLMKLVKQIRPSRLQITKKWS